MRKLIILLICLVPYFSRATDYYFSSSTGNDNNTGTQASPYASLSKLNTLNLVPGDNVYFKRGDVFNGQLLITHNGAAGSLITYGAYGTGAKPLITGFTTITSWVNKGNNIWESTNAVSTASYLNMVTFSGVNTSMGRYPNTGWLTYQSFSGTTSITSSSLTGTPNWTGANVVIKKFRYHIENNPITAQSGGTNLKCTKNVSGTTTTTTLF